MVASPARCCFPGGQFAAFLNAKPSDRAELLEELTGTEIYGQISAMVYEQHKAARHALEKFEAQAAGIVLLTEAQQQALQESLQVLTDEEKALLAQQQSQQQQLQWLTRRDELAQQQQQAATRQQQARQALADAAPALAKLELAQPAAQLRPLWERQQEQTAGLAQTRQRISEVNARLLASTALRARIRQAPCALSSSVRLNWPIWRSGWPPMSVSAYGVRRSPAGERNSRN